MDTCDSRNDYLIHTSNSWSYNPITVLLAVNPSLPRIASDLHRTCRLISGSASTYSGSDKHRPGHEIDECLLELSKSANKELLYGHILASPVIYIGHVVLYLALLPLRILIKLEVCMR
jgi:hypothetical protein